MRRSLPAFSAQSAQIAKSISKSDRSSIASINVSSMISMPSFAPSASKSHDKGAKREQNPPYSGNAAGSRPPRSAPQLPRNWQEISVGDLVLARQDPEDGWYETIVVEVANDMLTLRWRDYPRQRRFACHR